MRCSEIVSYTSHTNARSDITYLDKSESKLISGDLVTAPNYNFAGANRRNITISASYNLKL